MEQMAHGGATRAPAFITGDDPDGNDSENKEMILNPTGAPIHVVPMKHLIKGIPKFGDGTMTLDDLPPAPHSWENGREQAGRDAVARVNAFYAQNPDAAIQRQQEAVNAQRAADGITDWGQGRATMANQYGSGFAVPAPPEGHNALNTRMADEKGMVSPLQFSPETQTMPYVKELPGMGDWATKSGIAPAPWTPQELGSTIQQGQFNASQFSPGPTLPPPPTVSAQFAQWNADTPAPAAPVDPTRGQSFASWTPQGFSTTPPPADSPEDSPAYRRNLREYQRSPQFVHDTLQQKAMEAHQKGQQAGRMAVVQEQEKFKEQQKKITEAEKHHGQAGRLEAMHSQKMIDDATYAHLKTVEDPEMLKGYLDVHAERAKKAIAEPKLVEIGGKKFAQSATGALHDLETKVGETPELVTKDGVKFYRGPHGWNVIPGQTDANKHETTLNVLNQEQELSDLVHSYDKGALGREPNAQEQAIVAKLWKQINPLRQKRLQLMGLSQDTQAPTQGQPAPVAAASTAPAAAAPVPQAQQIKSTIERLKKGQ